MHRWEFAALTVKGIYNGEMIGEIEQGETEEHAMQVVSNIVKKFIEVTLHSPVVACFVSDSKLLCDAPRTMLTEINVTAEFVTESGD